MPQRHPSSGRDGDQLDRQRAVLGSQDRRGEVDPEPAALRVDPDLAADDSADAERETDAGVEVAVDLSQGVRSEDGHPHLERRLDGERGDVDESREDERNRSNRDLDIEIVRVSLIAGGEDGRASNGEDMDFLVGLRVALDGVVTSEQNVGLNCGFD